jgi:hypothetical protein
MKSMKAKPQKEITLAEIIGALDTMSLANARTELYKSVNASLFLSSTVLKVARRDGLKLHLQINIEASDRKLEAHAVFTDERQIEKVKELKIKKGSSVSLSGKFQTCGDSAVCIIDCRIRHTNTVRLNKAARKVAKAVKTENALVIDNYVHLKKPRIVN